MKKLLSVFLAAVILVLPAFSVGAAEAEAAGARKEISENDVILVDNDFSDTSLADYKLQGNWRVINGTLRTTGGSGSAYLVYEIPEKYEGMSYRIDVDFVGHTSTGGILIGGEGSGLASPPKAFYGFDCFIGPDGTQAALGCYNDKGSWGGNVVVSDSFIREKDLHFTVTVNGKNLTYTVTSLDGKTQYFGISYDLGTAATAATDKIYSSFGRKVGLRKFYSDQGAFDNFRVTVFTDDVLPEMNEHISLWGVDFKSSGIKSNGNTASGNGAMLTQKALEEDFTAELMLKPEGISKVLFGMTDEKNGFAFEINIFEEKLSLYRIKNGEYTWLGGKNMPIGDGEYLTSVSVTEKVVTVLFDAFSQGEEAFPVFELRVKTYKAGSLGIWLEGGSVSSLKITDNLQVPVQTYRNPVNTGADPALIFHEGTYYMYHRIQSKNDVFRVYTSANLVDWVAKDVVFTHKPEEYKNQLGGYMSPIPFYYDGTFYLFFTGKDAAGVAHIYCASSDSPYGPFEYKNGEKPLHSEKEIYGYPFVDDDGKVYLILNRFGNGNHIYMEEIKLEDGAVSIVPRTLKKIMSPVTEYENDGYGFVAEGGVILKHNGYYYLVWSTGHYIGHYGLAYAVSESVTGPYERYDYNEVLAYNSAVDGVGYGMFTPSPDGRELYVVYHKHAEVGKVSPRQTCVDKVQFVKNPEGGADILAIKGPTSTAQPLPSNIYRYDINRDGGENFLDVLLLMVRQKAEKVEYCGSYDVNADGEENFGDIRALFERVAGRY